MPLRGVTSTKLVLTIGLLAGGLLRAEEAAPAPRYGVTKTMHVGGDGRWDYIALDPATKLLYVSRQTHTQVLRAQTAEIVADLKDTPGVHGIALAPELHRGFISNGKGNSVTVFDLTSNQVLGTAATGENPDCILYDSSSKKVLAFNGKGHDVTVLDAVAAPGVGEVARIPLDGKPEFAAGDGEGHVYVNIEDKSEVTAIDTKTLKVSQVWKIEGGDEPSGLAIDVVHHRLFVGCGNQVMAVLDTQTGKTLATLPIGKGVDACAFDPGTGQAFASCGDGTLTIVKEMAEGKFGVVQTVQTRPGARTMALDPGTGTSYLPTAEFEPAEPGKRAAPKAGTFMIVVVAPTGK